MGCACLGIRGKITSSVKQNSPKCVQDNNANNNNEKVIKLHNMNQSNIISNSNIASNMGNAYYRIQFGQRYEPYLESKNDPSFNYPEIEGYINVGLKRMRRYKSPVTLTELKTIRNNFWSTRVVGDKEVWNTLRLICEDRNMSDEDIRGILMASNISLVFDCINAVYDEKGGIYEIPNYCINDPSDYEISEIEYNDVVPNKENITVKIRKEIKEIVVNICNHDSVDKLKDMISNEYNKDYIRFFFGGKELHDDKPLYHYHIQNNSIILLNYIPNDNDNKEKITLNQQIEKYAKNIPFVKINKK